MTFARINTYLGRMPFSRLIQRAFNPRIIGWLWRLSLPLGLLFIVLFFFPTRGDFEFFADEGVNLMKGMLVNQGYELYEEVWSDQPPFLTYLLVFDFKIFGYKVGAARSLVLFFSCLLLWASFEFTALVWGKSTGLMAGILIILLPKYLLWSFSVLIGLPAIALAMLSLLLLGKWHDQHKYVWLIFSALILGLSVITKLFTGFLAVIFVLGILVAEYKQFRTRRRLSSLIYPAALWAVIFAAFVLISLLFLVGSDNINQLFEDHQVASQLSNYNEQIVFTLGYHLKPAWPFLFLAVVGFIVTIWSKRWLFIYLFAWMVSAYTILYFHRPVWTHHQLLVTIPAAILGSAAVMEALPLVKKMVRIHFEFNWTGVIKWTALISLILFVFQFRIPESVRLLSISPSISTTGFNIGPMMEKFYYKMVEYAPRTHWVVTDMPMYAFRAHLLVPPSLVVFSDKRVRSGFLTQEQLLEVILEYQPEQVLLSKFEFPEVNAYLENHYWLVHSKDAMKLYIRNDLRK